MPDKKKKPTHDPKGMLQAAIEELDLFTQAEASRLEVGENGRLVASKESPLEKVVGLARCYIVPIFSEHRRREQAKKLEDLKQAILKARDIIQSHSALIIKFKEGDDAQRKLADYALSAIQRYNAVVSQADEGETAKYEVYNYERHRLLSDGEIKGQPIELPHTLSIKFDSHPDAHPASKMFKEMSQTLPMAAGKKTASMCPTHKKTIQFMIDTFHMKAIRMMQTHLTQQNSMAEIVPIVKGTPLEIDEESNPEFIAMQQLLEVGPGFSILVSGCFKRNAKDPIFLSMPMLDSFRLSFQVTHAGFPYPSQHTGWALADKWVEAFPLRSDQVPLFQKVDQRKKRLAQQLLYDQTFIQKARRLARLKKEVFDHHRDLFLPLFRQHQRALRQSFLIEDELILDSFCKKLEQAASPYDLLVQTQQQIQDLFIRQPIKALEDEWLDVEPTLLRVGSPQEKFHAACERLEDFRSKAQEQLNPAHPHHAYLLQQGKLLGHAFQSIGLQYQSEKMGFSPPLLNDFERKLQLCAFQQLLAFIDECENRLDISEPDQIRQHLLDAWTKDLDILQASSVEEEHSVPLAIIDELEIYFNSRFYAFHPRPIEKAV